MHVLEYELIPTDSNQIRKEVFMKKIFSITISSLSFFLLVFSFDAKSSMYPPDYSFSTECKINGPIKACRIRTISGWMFRVIYFGNLMETTYLPVNMYIKLNGKEGEFVLTKEKFSQFIEIGTSKRGCVYCGLPTLTEEEQRKCAAEPRVRGETGIWGCDRPSDKEKDLFFWAQDEFGLVNNWDIEVAFHQASRWDSDYGKNYLFKFTR